MNGVMTDVRMRIRQFSAFDRTAGIRLIISLDIVVPVPRPKRLVTTRSKSLDLKNVRASATVAAVATIINPENSLRSRVGHRYYPLQQPNV